MSTKRKGNGNGRPAPAPIVRSLGDRDIGDDDNILESQAANSEFVALVRNRTRNEGPKGSRAGRSWWRCSSARWRMRVLCEICNGLACSLGKLVHLGIGVAPIERLPAERPVEWTRLKVEGAAEAV